MKLKSKILIIMFMCSLCTIVVQAQGTINIHKGGRMITGKEESNLMIDSPSISFIDTVAVVLEYPTVASISYNNGRGFNDYLILNHLENVVNPDNYDFILMFSINEVPGGINSGWPFDISPKNIGVPKYLIASQRGIGYWKKLRAMPQMNAINWLTDMGSWPDWASIGKAFHEIGHNWGVYYHSDQDTSMNYRTWTNKYPLAYLAISCGGHWSYNWSDKIGIRNAPGLLCSGDPVSDIFNAFDLYNMGLMDYDEVKDYQYTIFDYNNNSYKINIDSFRYALSLKGADYYEGDGKRIPPVDNEVKNLRILIIVIKGQDEILTDDQKNLIINLAQKIPPAWNKATWGKSKMTVGIDKHLLGQASIINPINNELDVKNPVQFNWSSITGASAYDLQIAFDSLFSNLVKDTVITNIQATIHLSEKTTYFSRVRAENGNKNGACSKIITFKTAPKVYHLEYISGNNQTYKGGGMPLPLVFKVKNVTDNLYVTNLVAENLSMNATASTGFQDGEFGNSDNYCGNGDNICYGGFYYIELNTGSPYVLTITVTLKKSGTVESVYNITENISGTTNINDIRILGINIFPNPNSGILNIEYEDDNYKTINILNYQGMLLRKEMVILPRQQLDFSKYENGLYILEFVKLSGETKRVKLIKK